MYYCRPERSGDVADIHDVQCGAFPTPAEAQLVDALRRAARLAVSIVAAGPDGIVGHVAFSPVTAGDNVGLSLAPLAVREEHRRRGVGALLVREGLATCGALGCAYVVVLGDPAYYGRFGFLAAGERGLGNEYGANAEFMVLELRPGGCPPAGSLVRYAPEFARL